MLRLPWGSDLDVVNTVQLSLDLGLKSEMYAIVRAT
jgi:hypothetical protein